MKRDVRAYYFLGPLTAVLLFYVLLISGACAETTSEGYTYTVSEGKATITGYTGTSTTLNIPAMVGEFLGYPVTAIGDKAFYYRSDLTGNLVIPGSVTSIGNDAFCSCSSLTGSLVIPNSVTSIGEGAFSYCSSLNGRLTIGNGVTNIGQFAFYFCSNLTGNLVIPNSVTSIGYLAFNLCCGLTGDLVIPNSVASIEAFAFYRCWGLSSSLVIGNGVTSIGKGAFYDCTGFSKAFIFSQSYSLGTVLFNGFTPTVYGYEGTPIESYAATNGLIFRPLDNAVTRIIAVSGTSLKVTWSGVAGVTGYELWRSTSKTGTYKRVYAGTAKTFTNKYLKAGTAYYYKVRVYVTAGGVKSCGVLGDAKAGVPLAQPKILSVTATGSRSLKVSWGKVAGATGYMLYQSTTANGTYKLIKKTTALSFTKTGLISGKQYFYKVAAYKKVGTVKYLSPLSAYKAARAQ